MRKVYSEMFCATFSPFRTPFFSFGILQHFTPGLAFMHKVKGFCGLFFRGINKTRNWIKYEKCIVSVLYFVVCFAKIFAKCEIQKVYSRFKNTVLSEEIAKQVFLEKRREEATTTFEGKDCQMTKMNIGVKYFFINQFFVKKKIRKIQRFDYKNEFI